MSKKIKGSYLLNAVGVALMFALLTGLFAANAFGTSTTYIQGICTTACYTIIMVTSLNLVVGFMGEFSLGHAGFVSVGAYVSAIVSGALAGKGLSDLGLFLIALLVGGLAAGIMGVLSASRRCACAATISPLSPWRLPKSSASASATFPSPAAVKQ